ncbi:hypothetical protein [Terriglobus saanensis]|uniref:hypothetical protein n=1 Tax=Terriglobus saanensis TaxID=870903 RepID=UPI00031E8642|nr:hypothetical protein [Terriglobus saanensis]
MEAVFAGLEIEITMNKVVMRQEDLTLPLGGLDLIQRDAGYGIEAKATLVQASFPRRPVGVQITPEERNTSLLARSEMERVYPCEDQLRRLHAHCLFRHQ